MDYTCKHCGFSYFMEEGYNAENDVIICPCCGVVQDEKEIKTHRMFTLLNEFDEKFCEHNLEIPTVGLCCGAYHKSKRNDGKEWMHFPFCNPENCPLEHPELLEGATL